MKILTVAFMLLFNKCICFSLCHENFISLETQTSHVNCRLLTLEFVFQDLSPLLSVCLMKMSSLGKAGQHTSH